MGLGKKGHRQQQIGHQASTASLKAGREQIYRINNQFINSNLGFLIEKNLILL